MGIYLWLKKVLWDSWHGVSVSAVDTRRTALPESERSSEGFQIGNIRIPRWLVWLLAAILILVLIVIAFRLAGYVLTFQKQLDEQATLRMINSCYAIEESTGRRFVALDCLFREMATSVARSEAASNVLGSLMLILTWIACFIAGWIARGVRDRRYKEA